MTAATGETPRILVQMVRLSRQRWGHKVAVALLPTLAVIDVTLAATTLPTLAVIDVTLAATTLASRPSSVYLLRDGDGTHCVRVSPDPAGDLIAAGPAHQAVWLRIPLIVSFTREEC